MSARRLDRRSGCEWLIQPAHANPFRLLPPGTVYNDEQVGGWGVDVRADVFLGERGRWGLGGALGLSDLEPSFVDLEAGASGSLQTSGMSLRLGLRRRW